MILLLSMLACDPGDPGPFDGCVTTGEVFPVEPAIQATIERQRTLSLEALTPQAALPTRWSVLRLRLSVADEPAFDVHTAGTGCPPDHIRVPAEGTLLLDDGTELVWLSGSVMYNDTDERLRLTGITGYSGTERDGVLIVDGEAVGLAMDEISPAALSEAAPTHPPAPPYVYSNIRVVLDGDELTLAGSMTEEVGGLGWMGPQLVGTVTER